MSEGPQTVPGTYHVPAGIDSIVATWINLLDSSAPLCFCHLTTSTSVSRSKNHTGLQSSRRTIQIRRYECLQKG